jgi:hypothetical protein
MMHPGTLFDRLDSMAGRTNPFIAIESVQADPDDTISLQPVTGYKVTGPDGQSFTSWRDGAFDGDMAEATRIMKLIEE